MKKFIEPEIVVNEFEMEDVITTSGFMPPEEEENDTPYIPFSL